MSKKKKIVVTISIILYILSIAVVLNYRIIFCGYFSLKNWECDPDWEEPKYYEDGIADSLIEECARYGADNIDFSQSCDGKYKYIYDAEKDKYDDSEYNIVRHAGTTYAILDLYEELEEEKYLTTGEAGLDYLCQLTYKINKNKWAIEYDGDMKVGTVSLAILGMVRYWEATDDDKYNLYVKKYCNFILSQQRDDGAFAGIYGSDEESSYYSGEALFALALAYDMLEKEKYLEATEDALDFYWSEDYDYYDSAFIPWASSGCAKWYEMTGEDDFLDFCFEMTDRQILRQHIIDDEDELGNHLYGYMNAETVNTACYLEGIGDALRVAKSVNDTERVEKYFDCLKAGIEWVLSLQFRKKSQLTCPNRAFGGFHRGFTVDDSYIIRIDYTQHAISALLRVLREFDEDELDSIEIRNGKVDFTPKEREPPSKLWWIIPLIIGLFIFSTLLIYYHCKKFLVKIEILNLMILNLLKISKKYDEFLNFHKEKLLSDLN